MTLKKLAAGSGYEYLTRQVAAADSTELGKTPLADYYAAKGEAPGRWIGSGLVGLEGIEYSDVVNAEQMKKLLACVPLEREGGRTDREGLLEESLAWGPSTVDDVRRSGGKMRSDTGCWCGRQEKRVSQVGDPSGNYHRAVVTGMLGTTGVR